MHGRAPARFATPREVVGDSRSRPMQPGDYVRLHAVLRAGVWRRSRRFTVGTIRANRPTGDADFEASLVNTLGPLLFDVQALAQSRKRCGRPAPATREPRARNRLWLFSDRGYEVQTGETSRATSRRSVRCSNAVVRTPVVLVLASRPSRIGSNRRSGLPATGAGHGGEKLRVWSPTAAASGGSHGWRA